MMEWLVIAGLVALGVAEVAFLFWPRNKNNDAGDGKQ